jgi:RNA polymerase sigma factor (sigma-70 family)
LPDTSDDLDTEVDARALVAAFKTLTPKQALTIARIYYDGAAVREVARECGISPMAVRDRRDGALRKLERLLKEVDDDG